MRRPTLVGAKYRMRRLIDAQRMQQPDAQPAPFPDDLTGTGFREVYERVAPFTMTHPERLYALHEAVKYVVRADVGGAFVECGVWRGGSSMMAALAFQSCGDLRNLYLFDTFEGMPPPSATDRRVKTGEHASSLLVRDDLEGDHTRAVAGLAEVRRNLDSTGYPLERLHFVKGMVEETIPGQAPEQISVLRLDTDWYESTRHELEHLYPRLVPGGVLILDDYGYWQGARQAVDEYFAERPVLLNRIDNESRLVVRR
jgi:O-methyltransferase